MLRNVSIRAKGIILAVATVCLALTTTGVFLFVYNMGAIRDDTVERQQSQARMLSHHCVAVLADKDVEGASVLLDSFSMLPSVERAVLYDSDGVEFARYPNRGLEDASRLQLKESTTYTSDGRLEIQRSVFDHSGEQIGTLFIRSGMGVYYARFRDHIAIMLTILVGSLLLSVLLAERLQRGILHPIQLLADASHRIRDGQDYSIRVEHQSDDELGQLCQTFNGMVEEIGEAKEALDFANERLERRVADRTAQLTQEIERREQAQHEMELARDEAVSANLAKSQFLANMSHEIRTPLNGVLGFTDLLVKGADQGDEQLRRDYLQTISGSGKHLPVLINDVLDISKIEAGQMEVEHAACSPHEIINQVVSILRVDAQKKGLELDYGWNSPVPEHIVSDSARLRQMVMNLVGNAIKFTEMGRVSIDASVDEEQSRLSIAVSDTGVGIGADRVEAIFDPFVQADTSVTRKFGATGLGLAISRRIANALGGDIEVASKQGAGSTFSLNVQVSDLENTVFHDEPLADALTTAGSDDQVARLDDVRILVVEDGPTNRKLIKILLERAGAVIGLAENGLVGVEMATRNEYDIILMDMQMPVMDGYTAARRLRELQYSLPIFGLTAHAMKGDERKCLDAGCSGYLTKPISEPQLISAIRDAVPHAITPLAPRSARPVDAPAVQAKPSIASTNSTSSSAADASNAIHSSLPTEDEVFAEIVVEFVDYLRDLLEKMNSAAASENWQDLSQLAHSLKGAGGPAGFDDFTEPSRLLETAAKSEQLESIPESIASLHELAARIQVPHCESTT